MAQAADDEDLARKIFRITLEDDTVKDDTYVRSIALGMSQMKLADQDVNSRKHSGQHEEEAWRDYHVLYLLDCEAHNRVHAVTNVIDKLDTTGDDETLAALLEEHAWMEKTLREVMNTNIGTDACNEQFRHAHLQLLQETKEAAESVMRVIAHRTAQNPNSKDDASETIETDCHLERFSNAKPALLLAMFIALVLNFLGHVTRPWCNAVLELLNLLLKTMLGNASEGYDGSKGYIPCDIRSVWKKFDLEVVTKTFSTCARCSCTYLPNAEKKSPAMRKKSGYPERCSYKKYRGSKPCRQLLVKRTKESGQVLYVPVRPYVVQDFNSFLAGLLSRPGMEEAMDRGTMVSNDLQIWDIKDGTAIGEILGSDGKPFIDGLKRTDLRLAWSLSVDWFNPYGNKTSGKKKSIGSIAMGLLNLPPSLRYKAENMYLVGIIPGPRELALNEINHFLRLVVDFFLPSWKDGTWFTKTVKHATGRLSQSVIAVAVNDLPMARKIAGCAGPTANQMCGLCWLMKSNIANFDCERWTRRTLEEHKAAAEKWKNAETKVNRDKIFKQYGVRWSELLRLPYWDPTRFIVIDGMHNLFLGLVQHHFRDLIMIDKQANKELRKGNPRPVDSKELEKGRQTLMSNPTVSAMTRLRVAVLEALVQEYGVQLSNRTHPRKKDMIEALLSALPVCVPMDVEIGENELRPCDQAFITDELIEEYAAQVHTTELSRSAEVLVNREINDIQEMLGRVRRPSWHCGPPKNLGDAEHGKLKAEQCKSSIEFDLPVALMHLWGSGRVADGAEHRSQRQKLVHSMMLLATAIHWGTSHVTSPHHAQQYTMYMKVYLECIQEIFPHHSWCPNHHAALHIREFLLRYGPMHGWWMFPFERIIGVLQKTNTNYKIGELEKTMLETFCAATNVKAMMQNPMGPVILNEAMEILGQYCDPFTGGEKTNMNILSTVGQNASSHQDIHVLKTPVPNGLEKAWQIAETHLCQGRPYARSKRLILYKHLNVLGVQYSSHAWSNEDSNVFFQRTLQEFVPGVIEYIFSTGEEDQQTYYFALRHNIPLAAEHQDPFQAYGDFGAQLWSSTQSQHLDIVPVGTSRICHSISMKWGETNVVVKPLNRDFGVVCP